MRNLNINLLRTFIATADTMSFVGAAKRVHLTQPAISQQMRQLEELFGRKLFRKDGRGRQLTEDGHALLEYSRRVIALNDEIIAEFGQSKRTGYVRIGASHDCIDSLLPPVLRRISETCPGLFLELRADRSPFLMEALAKGDIDIAVTTRADPDFLSIPFAVSRVIWICSKSLRLDRQKPLPLVVPREPSLFRAIALNALDEAHIPWRLAHVALNPGAIRASLKAELGITARNAELLAPGLVEVPKSLELPLLPSVTFQIYMHPRKSNDTTRDLFSMFRKWHERGELGVPIHSGSPGKTRATVG